MADLLIFCALAYVAAYIGELKLLGENKLNSICYILVLTEIDN